LAYGPGRGGERRGEAVAPLVSEIFEIFRADVDDSGKSTREKTFQKVVKARLVGYFL